MMFQAVPSQAVEGIHAADMKSVKSKRSLSINVNKVSKIVKLARNGSSALS